MFKLFLIILLLFSCARYEPITVPKCPKVQLQDGSYACKYTLEEVKTIYKIGAEVSILREENAKLRRNRWGYWVTAITGVIVAVVSIVKD